MAGGDGTRTGGNGKARAGGLVPAASMTPGPDQDHAGRIPDLDTTIRKAFFDVLAESGNVGLACKVIGIHRSTANRWRAKGLKSREGKYYSFARTVERGMAEWERRQIAIIRKAAEDFTAEEDWAEQWTKGDGASGETRSKIVKRRKRKKGDWRAAAFLLERKFPRRWGPHQTVELEGKLDLVDVLTQLRDEAEKKTTDRLEMTTTPRSGTGSQAQGSGGSG